MGYIGNICKALPFTILVGTPIVMEENSERNAAIIEYVGATTFNTLVDYCNSSEALEVSGTIADSMPKWGRKAKLLYLNECLVDAFSNYMEDEKATDISKEIVSGIPETIRNKNNVTGRERSYPL